MEEKVAQEGEKVLSKVIRIDENEVKKHLSELVRGTVEETLNSMLDQEADILCGAKRYERSPERLDTRAGSYKRNLHTKAGEVELKVPKLRSLPFETQIIERYRRRESSVEEALVEMYLAGVSVRRVEDITEALWGTRVSASTVSSLNKKIYGQIDQWRKSPLEVEYPYVHLDGIWLKRSWGGEVRNVSILVAMGVDAEGYRSIIGACEGLEEDKDSWGGFLRDLKARGLKGVRLIASDCCLGLVESIGEIFPEVKWQRCVAHWYRNVLTGVPRNMMKDVASMLKAIHAQEDRAAALEKSQSVVRKLKERKLSKAAKVVEDGVADTLSYMCFPTEHWTRLRTNNPLERIMLEIRRRTRVVGSFPDGESALMLAAARLRHIAATRWGTKKYMDMEKLYEMERNPAA
jgi:transposase-like protein